jgi:hypothetical protein
VQKEILVGDQGENINGKNIKYEQNFQKK